MIRTLPVITAALFLAAATGSPAAEPGDILGKWQTIDDETKEVKSTVEIYEEGERYFGRIVSLTEPLYPEDDERGMAGEPKVDRNNPDESKREVPLVGLVILRDLKYQDGRWVQGKIYDPGQGKTYRCRIELEDDGRLKVRGYIGFSLLGRTQHWEKVSGLDI